MIKNNIKGWLILCSHYIINTFIEAFTFKTKKEAQYKNALIKGNYKVIDINEAIKMNLL